MPDWLAVYLLVSLGCGLGLFGNTQGRRDDAPPYFGFLWPLIALALLAGLLGAIVGFAQGRRRYGDHG